jgi:RNA polymerase sigma-70 factor, ECF subfamily
MGTGPLLVVRRMGSMAFSGRMRSPFVAFNLPFVFRPARPSLSRLDDAALMQRVAGSDQAAIGALYDRLAASMLRMAFRMLRSQREAEDLVHDVFVEACANAHRYDAGRSSVRSWLMLRLRSRALDRLRSERRHKRLVFDECQFAVANDSAALRDGHRLQGLIAGLPIELREVIELAYFAGCSSSEVARELAIPVGTVKSRMSRALTILREQLHVHHGAKA